MQSVLTSELKQMSLYFNSHLLIELQSFPIKKDTSSFTPVLFSTYWGSKAFETSKGNILISYASLFTNLPGITYNHFELEILDLHNTISSNDFFDFTKRTLSLIDHFVTYYQSLDFLLLTTHPDPADAPPDLLFSHLHLSIIHDFYLDFYLPLLKLFFNSYFKFINPNFLLYSKNTPLYHSLNFIPPVLPPLIFTWHYAVALAILQNCKELPMTLGHKKQSIYQAMTKFNIHECTANTVYGSLCYMMNPANKDTWDIDNMFNKHFVTTNRTGYKSVVRSLIGSSKPALTMLNGLIDSLLVFLVLA